MDSDARGIVVGYDGSPGAQVALDWAAGMAQRQGVPLTILHSADIASGPQEPPSAPGSPPTRLDLDRAVLNEGVERAAAVLGAGQVVGSTVPDSPSAALVAASAGASMVVTGCRGREALVAGLLGSVSYAVASHAKCPAVVVRGEKPALPDADHQVVVGVDDSEASRRALDVAAQLAASGGATLRVVRVGHLRDAEAWAYAETSKAGTEHTHAESAGAEGTLPQAGEHARQAYPGLAVETEALFGKPGPVLSQLGEHASLIVLGSRGRGGFAGLLLGSVSHTVIHEAACPVMVVKD